MNSRRMILKALIVFLGLHFFALGIVQASEALKIKAVTINVGLLDGILASVPGYSERREELTNELKKLNDTEGRAQVIFIQELWYKKDAEVIRNWAKKNNYVSASLESPYSSVDMFGLIQNVHSDLTGLEILIEKKLFEGTSKYKVGFEEYVDSEDGRVRATWEMAANIRRGLFYAELTLKDERKILFATTHLTPQIDANQIRLEQVESLSKILNKSPADTIIFGGDLNISDNFEYKLSFPDMEGTPVDWAINAQSYDALMALVPNMKDTWRIVNPSDLGFTEDRTLNDLTRISDSTRVEPEQRIDYVFVINKMGSLEIIGSKIVFDQPILDKKGNVRMVKYGKEESTQGRLFLSDHFGVMSDIVIK